MTDWNTVAASFGAFALLVAMFAGCLWIGAQSLRRNPPIPTIRDTERGLFATEADGGDHG